MTTLLISQFKAKCIEVLNAVHEGGETVVVTRRGKPLARILPISGTHGRRQLGLLAGESRTHGDIVRADFSADWESLG